MSKKGTLLLEITFDIRTYPDQDCAALARSVLRDFNESRERAGYDTQFKYGPEIEIRLQTGAEYTYKLKAVVYEQRAISKS